MTKIQKMANSTLDILSKKFAWVKDFDPDILLWFISFNHFDVGMVSKFLENPGADSEMRNDAIN
ncbi:hypothetical protein CP10139811_0428 [Chlamydia ibidis]|uniref:Uncharacterized protein n=1 Tax=Chlamydia ibidis TaxID=1405396 RepID=S7J396_9CHLA|nr:hypothetical protein CP10139811_0428 [Chlamydia ibidis]